MNRIAVIFVAVLLFAQTVFSGLTGGFILEAKAEDHVLAVDSVTEMEGQVETIVHWSTKGIDVSEGYTESLELNETYIVSEGEHSLSYEAMTEDVLFSDEVVGAYTLSDEGTLTITFDEQSEVLEEEMSGQMTIVADIEQEQSTEQDEENEAVTTEEVVELDEEVTEEDVVKEEKETTTTKEEEEEVTKETETTKEQTIQPFHHDEHVGFTLELSDIKDLKDNPYNDDNPLKPGDEFFLNLEWALADNHNYKEGHYEIVQLPDAIEIEHPITGEELKDEFGNVVATYEVDTEGKVTITFTDYVEHNSDIKGWIELRAQLDQDEAQEEDGKIIVDPIGEEGRQEVPVDRTPKDKTVEKQGKPNQDYNADEIEWTVTINKNAYTFKDVVVEDLLPEGTEYKEGSLKVEKQQASINGTPIGEAEEVSVTPKVDGQKLSIPLGDIEEVYTITYTTTVTDFEKKNFKNEVMFKDKELEDVPADSTVTIDRGEPLKKGGIGGTNAYDPKTGILTWYLEFNYDQKSLEDITLSDQWTPAGKVELVEDSVSFQEMKIDENGVAHKVGEAVKPSEINANLNKKEDGFEISDITTDKPYYIVYETKVKDRVVDKDGFRFENKAKFDGNKDGEGYNVGQFVGKKSAGTIDYTEKTIEWTITVNEDERQMNDVIIEDTLGEGLTLLDDSIEMTIGGEPYEDFKLENKTENLFKITNIGDTAQEIVVTYKTTYDPNKLPNNKAKNEADISWLPEDEDERINLEVEADKNLNKETADASWKNATYNPDTKEITWTIIANYRENAYDDFNISDTPQGNQQLVKDSIKVEELKIKSDGSMQVVKDAEPTITTDGNKIDIQIGNTDKATSVA